MGKLASCIRAHKTLGYFLVHVTEVEGKQALFVVNLEPREMMGEKSEGMLFDIGYADKITPVLATPEKPVPDGTRAG
ncbi:MAG: hypothetical protein GF390_00450 [Candidatus Pacebacteria bacterium]|nr:hypothetical protein [Candidatus Paceibacterota bacterium]